MGPESLAQYKILDRLGGGALGELYRARDTRLGRTVAIRVLSSSLTTDPGMRERVLRDARMASALSHPNIAAVYEVGEDQGLFFLACEFVPGDSLRTTMGGHPIHPRRAVDLAAQLADALADGHAAGIIHGRLAPENIVVTPKGNAKCLDFGLSAWADGRSGDAARNVSDDIAALGGLLSEMVTGRVHTAGAAPPGTVNRELPRELDAIVMKAVATDGEHGYQSAATFAAELRSVAAILDVRSGSAAPVNLVRLAPRRSGRRIAAALVVAALVGAAWLAREPAMRRWRTAFGPPPAPVIAVLPLELETTDESQGFFADGLTEDLSRRLARIPGVIVLGRSTVRRDRGRTAGEVADELGAALVLTGRVRPQASPFTMVLELVEPADGAVLWTSEYSSAPSDTFAVLAEVADDVAGALGLVMPPSAARARAAARVVEPVSYRAYLQGRQAAAEGRFTEAVGFYQQAADNDAGLGEAFAALALSLDVGTATPADVERRDAAAAHAYQLDPDLPEANAAMALASSDVPTALEYLRHGVDVDRSWGDGYRRIGDRIREVDPARAAAFYRASLAVDPRLDASRAGLALALELPQPADASEERDTIRTVLQGILD